MYSYNPYYEKYLAHFGILGMKWGRRKQKRKEEKQYLKQIKKEQRKRKRLTRGVAAVAGLTALHVATGGRSSAFLTKTLSDAFSAAKKNAPKVTSIIKENGPKAISTLKSGSKNVIGLTKKYVPKVISGTKSAAKKTYEFTKKYAPKAGRVIKDKLDDANYFYYQNLMGR